MKAFRVALSVAALAPTLALACAPGLEGGTNIESARYRIAYRLIPARVSVGKPFAIDLVVCPKNALDRLVELRVDAHMPAHRHGMNYKASIDTQGDTGRFRAQGLMFHMPGTWEILFDMRSENGTERMTQEYRL